MAEFPTTTALTDDTKTKAQMKAILTDWLLATQIISGGASEQALVISSGLVVPGGGMIVVSSESGTSDDLTNADMTNFESAALLFVRAESGHTITIKHSYGAGNGRFFMASAGDLILSNPQTVVLFRRSGSDWYEYGRFGYGVTTPASTSSPGVSELATDAEALTGTDPLRVITCAALAYVLGQKTADPSQTKAYTGQHYSQPITLTSAGGALAVDCNTCANALHTLTANTTVSAASNQAAGKVVCLTITGASSYTLSWNSNWKETDLVKLPSAPAAGKKLFVIAESDGTYMWLRSVLRSV